MTYLLALFLNLGWSWQPFTLKDAFVHQRVVAGTKGMPVRLSESAVSLHMQSLPDWTTDGESLFYTRNFDNFVEAIDFVNRLVEPAEELAHHPDIIINYNRVSLQLTTHDAGGLTELDFQLAQKISQL